MPEPRPARVAVVDDNIDDVVLARLAFRRAGLSIDFEPFKTGEAFLAAMAARSAEDQPMPDLVLVDLNLPMLRGYDVIARARDAAWSCGMTLGVCSGSADPADRKLCAAAGSVFFLPKPVTGETVAAICRAAPAFTLAPSTDGRRLLVSA